MSDGIILVTDPRSAKAVTLNLWESRKGNLFKDEQTARSAGMCLQFQAARILKQGFYRNV